MAAPTLTTPIVTGGLNCTQPKIRRMLITCIQNADGTMGAIKFSADESPYDPVANQCASMIQTTNVNDAEAMAEGLLAQSPSRPLFGIALQAILDGLGDMTNNGIPENLKSLGFVANPWKV